MGMNESYFKSFLRDEISIINKIYNIGKGRASKQKNDELTLEEYIVVVANLNRNRATGPKCDLELIDEGRRQKKSVKRN